MGARMTGTRSVTILTCKHPRLPLGFLSVLVFDKLPGWRQLLRASHNGFLTQFYSQGVQCDSHAFVGTTFSEAVQRETVVPALARLSKVKTLSCRTAVRLVVAEWQYRFQYKLRNFEGTRMLALIVVAFMRCSTVYSWGLHAGSFFGSCSNVFLLLFLLLTLAGGIWLVRSILRKRYARVSQVGLEYEADHDNIEA